MKVAVLGATGGVGRHFVNYALERKYQVKVLARSPQKLQNLMDKYGSTGQLEVMTGDSTSEADVKALVDPTVDVLVCAIGNTVGGAQIMSKSVNNILSAAKARHKIAEKSLRVIMISSLGMGGSSPLVKTVLTCITGSKNIADYEKADETMLEAVSGLSKYSNGLSGIVVRPTELSDDDALGQYNATEKSGLSMSGAISRKDVALFLADQVEDSTWNAQAVQLYRV